MSLELASKDTQLASLTRQLGKVPKQAFMLLTICSNFNNNDNTNKNNDEIIILRNLPPSL